MTSERPRFPIGLTLAAVIVFAICVGLGVWQLQRAAWKAHALARIEALKSAPPQPIGPVLARAATGADASFTRVAADCGPDSHAVGYRLTTDNGEWIARAQALCILASGPYPGILVDRGFFAASRGATSAPDSVLPPPTHVVGVLYDSRPRSAPLLKASTSTSLTFKKGAAPEQPVPYILVAEAETPPAPGVTPAPYPDAATNLEYVGSYAPTWFGLAGVAACFYAAMLWRRYYPKR
jgi:surfeit locus 1 family protein